MGNQKFTSARRDLNHKAAFDLSWYDENETEQQETFYCYPGRLPGGILFDVLKINDGSAPFWEFWESVMDEATYAEFRACVRKNPIEASSLREVMDWVIEYDTGRPTEQPSS